MPDVKGEAKVEEEEPDVQPGPVKDESELEEVEDDADDEAEADDELSPTSPAGRDAVAATDEAGRKASTTSSSSAEQVSFVLQLDRLRRRRASETSSR